MGILALPADSHVHSEWSWDAPLGWMELSCAQAADMAAAHGFRPGQTPYDFWPRVN